MLGIRGNSRPGVIWGVVETGSQPLVACLAGKVRDGIVMAITSVKMVEEIIYRRLARH